MKPQAIDLFCGLGGWTDGLLATGFDVVGFDITRHVYARHIQHPGNPTETVIDRYPAQIVLQDILTVHGSQFRNAALIVASPPCQAYSYLAMPWSRSSDPENSKAAKALRKKWENEGPDNRLFDACFRIQREACEAAGRYIPLIVENVRGAVPWVGPAKAKFGSFYLWGDVGMVGNRVFAGRDLTDVMAGRGRFDMGVAPESGEQKREGHNFHTWALTGGAVSSPSYHGGDHETRGVGMGVKVPGQIQGKEYAMCRTGAHGQKQLHTRGNNQTAGRHRMGLGAETTPDGTKIGGDWFRDPACHSKHGSRSNARKAASAMIAKIPFALSSYVAHVHYPGIPAAAEVPQARALESVLAARASL